MRPPVVIFDRTGPHIARQAPEGLLEPSICPDGFLPRTQGTSRICRSLTHPEQVFPRPVIVKHDRPAPQPPVPSLCRRSTRPAHELRYAAPALPANAVLFRRNQRNRPLHVSVPHQHDGYRSTPFRVVATAADLYLVVFFGHHRRSSRSILLSSTAIPAPHDWSAS
jgi:hypothetical protein